MIGKYVFKIIIDPSKEKEVCLTFAVTMAVMMLWRGFWGRADLIPGRKVIHFYVSELTSNEFLFGFQLGVTEKHLCDLDKTSRNN